MLTRLKLREDILGVDSIVFLRDYYNKREFQASRFTPGHIYTRRCTYQYNEDDFRLQ